MFFGVACEAGRVHEIKPRSPSVRSEEAANPHQARPLMMEWESQFQVHMLVIGADERGFTIGSLDRLPGNRGGGESLIPNAKTVNGNQISRKEEVDALNAQNQAHGQRHKQCYGLDQDTWHRHQRDDAHDKAGGAEQNKEALIKYL